MGGHIIEEEWFCYHCDCDGVAEDCCGEGEWYESWRIDGLYEEKEKRENEREKQSLKNKIALLESKIKKMETIIQELQDND